MGEGSVIQMLLTEAGSWHFIGKLTDAAEESRGYSMEYRFCSQWIMALLSFILSLDTVTVVLPIWSLSLNWSGFSTVKVNNLPINKCSCSSDSRHGKFERTWKSYVMKGKNKWSRNEEAKVVGFL